MGTSMKVWTAPEKGAWHGDAQFKAAFMGQLAWHREQDALVKGTFEKYEVVGEARKFRGCAIGCSAESFAKITGKRVGHRDHFAVAEMMGIPPQLTYLENHIFENLPHEQSQSWPERFAGAIELGADFTMVWPLYAVWLLTDPEWGVSRLVAEGGEAYKAVAAVASLYERRIAGGKPTDKEWDQAADNAWAAWAADAVYANRTTYAAWAASVAWDAWGAYDAGDDRAGEVMIAQADKLIELMRGAPLVSVAGHEK